MTTILFIVIAILLVLLVSATSRHNSEMREIQKVLFDYSEIINKEKSTEQIKERIISIKEGSVNIEKSSSVLQKEIKVLSEKIREKDRFFEKLKNNKNSAVSSITSLFADFLTIEYQMSADILSQKKDQL